MSIQCRRRCHRSTHSEFKIVVPHRWRIEDLSRVDRLHSPAFKRKDSDKARRFLFRLTARHSPASQETKCLLIFESVAMITDISSPSCCPTCQCKTNSGLIFTCQKSI